MKTKVIIASTLMVLSATLAQAQVNIRGSVFGGARQADVEGKSMVTIYGGSTSASMVIISGVYGGNDIAGTVIRGSEVTTDGGNQLFIGQLFGGGNGDYEYTEVTTAGDENYGKYRVTRRVWDEETSAWVTEELGYVDAKPEITNAAINLTAGTFGYVFGGGNAATVTNSANITIEIPAALEPLDIAGEAGDEDDLITDDELQAMGINTEFFDQSGTYHISRVFGGNNKAEMAIQPSWTLNRGKIENLYSGGNEGKMTSETGLLLNIDPQVPEGTSAADAETLKKELVIDNVFGGCRKADVDPRFQTGDHKGEPVDHVENLAGYIFPRDFAARVRVLGGDINNVYGGNDVSGHVKFGNAVGIYCSIRGNVYGGGNGSYAYTDNLELKNAFPLRYGDFYYDVNALLGKDEDHVFTGMESAQALNLFRPDAEQVSVRLIGTAGKKTIIGGSVFCGGNSATLKMDPEKVANNSEYPNYPIVELKVGSHVVANEVFLGNNGENMVKKTDEAIGDCVLHKYAWGVDPTSGEISESSSATGWLDYSQMELANTTDVDSETGRTQFEEYMEGCAMGLIPRVVFDTDYQEYSSYIGSLYCGGNVGSMTVDGLISIPFNDKVVIFDKLVGGCNNANVAAIAGYNTAYKGGLLNSADATTGNKLELTFNGLKVQPKRWNIDGDENYVLDSDGYPLQWNTIRFNTTTNAYEEVEPVTTGTYADGHDAEADDLARRLSGGNIYGGCYSSGHVNGNVVINLDATIVDRDKVFDQVKTDDLGEEESLYGGSLLVTEPYKILQRHTGVILGQQGMDVLGKSLNVFGGGYGVDSEIWGSTTINLNRGYTFQVFGGGESGSIGKKENGVYSYNPIYSCFINLKGQNDGVSKAEDQSEGMAECEFAYGGGFFGTIAGNTVVNLGKGRVFNTFAGSCNADILGHTETYIGRQVKGDYTVNGVTRNYSKEMLKHYLDHYLEPNYSGSVSFQAHNDFYDGGFPYIRDIVYGGNDLGGRILGEAPVAEGGAGGQDCNFSYRVTDNARGKVYKTAESENPPVLIASAYMEYTQGRADAIFGGCFGTYDYTDPHYGEYFYATGATDIDGHVAGEARPGYSKPRMNNAFVNFRPVTGITSEYNWVKEVYGAGQGYPGEADRDKMQNRSYVLIDIPDAIDSYQEKGMKIFGAGAWGGVGMGVDAATYTGDKDTGSAIVDLVSGKVGSAYGASYKEGFTRRTVVNVPDGSSINISKIFGGGEGVDEDGYRNIKPCDAYEANVNYDSESAVVTGAIYGGNNAYRRTLYSKVNINTPVRNGQTDLKGNNITTTVYGAGCGENTWSQYTEVNLNSGAEVYEVYGGGQNGRVLNSASVKKWQDAVGASNLQLSETASIKVDGEETNPCVDNGLANALVTVNVDGSRHNTNVHIREGATVDWYYVRKRNWTTGQEYEAWDGGYAYGGGLGSSSIPTSGDVLGSTYIDLLGGMVRKDLYGAGTQGSVMDQYGTPAAPLTDDFGQTFVATSNVFIKGGTARNVYGGGWAGSVGKHTGGLAASYAADVPGETHVVIGTTDGTSFTDGIPTVERNAYGGGEGGAVWGKANITMYNGYIGYRYFTDQSKLESLDGEVVPYETKTIGSWTGYYQEKIHDETWTDRVGKDRLKDSGCLFGGGYVDNSSVDHTEVRLYGGMVRNSLFGGGEIAAIGRGTVDGTGKVRTLTGIYKAGTTLVGMHDGWVKRDVFGGGRGYNNMGEQGTLYSDGYVFGKTEVHIHGGEVGTEEGVARGEGNVFGGGDIGYVYSAYEDASGRLAVGQKHGSRYDAVTDGYYYKYEGDGVVLGSGGTFTGGAFVGGSPTQLTEDCKVLIEPECKVTAAAGVTINSHPYSEGDYVPIGDLNTLGNKADETWESLEIDRRDDEGIIIHNAVFAGGNVASGSTNLYANATTVFGNATASIHDVYHRDLITIGTGHTGGLYGDGNLTFVDGYRGLNITNYGTDYYSIAKEITQAQYGNLSKREQAYYELRYKCVQDCTDNEGKAYYAENSTRAASTITRDEFLAVFEGRTEMFDAEGNPNSEYWVENGVCSRYAGRIMNTIQRADFCGVFGSRMVMQGARDRVPSTADLKNYTINRVREVSLNKMISTAGDAVGTQGYQHGNYFGIYNIVNNLGNLTSDVDFHTAVRTSDNDNTDIYHADVTIGGSTYHYGEANYTFYNWKRANYNGQVRNNGNSHNQVALASGVYLEVKDMDVLDNRPGAQDGDEWGYITGVVELDLINVQQGIGGGFVYAKNEHGKLKSYSRNTYATLTALNANAVTRKDYAYETADADKVEWETSGNFIHSTQVIIDDCYPTSNKYTGSDAVPVHYWFIKGQVYVYDQYISAYTGAPNAYSEVVDIPLTITAASNGVMKLLNVKPNLYAYYSSYSNGSGTKLSSTQGLEINNVTYHLNDPISYWDWYMLSRAEKNLFVEKTYVTIADCMIGSTPYPEGYVMLPEDYTSLMSSATTQEIEGESVKAVQKATKDEDGNIVGVTDGNGQPVYVAFDYIFRESNNMGHDTGYILTYKVDNPLEWADYYMLKTASSGVEPWRTDKTLDDKSSDDNYHGSPTYRYIGSATGELLGQREYKKTNLISEDVYDTYNAAIADHPGVTLSNQAEFYPAYLMTSDVDDVNKLDGTNWNLKKDAALAKEEFVTRAAGVTDAEYYADSYTNAEWDKIKAYVTPAYVSTKTVTLSETDYISLGMKMTGAERTQYTSTYSSLAAEIEASVVPAYYCAKEGNYGGDYYAAGTNYRALAAWSSMSKADREKFAFNYDALDLLIDPDYKRAEGVKYQYDLPYIDNNGNVDFNLSTATDADKAKMIYSLEKPVDYQATYHEGETTTTIGEGESARKVLQYTDANSTAHTIDVGQELTRTEYEAIPNEQRHYTPVTIVNDDGTLCLNYFVVKTSFFSGDSNYPAGTVISQKTYSSLGTYQDNVVELTFADGKVSEGDVFYFCRESYTVDENGEGVSPVAVSSTILTEGNQTWSSGTVPVGLVISNSSYSSLPNKQKDFTIHGKSPVETSTLYVSRNSDIYDLSTEKIITVIYEYDYDESDAQKNHITPITERHVVNIHITFKSGIPEVEDISAPKIVLPGTGIQMSDPHVTPGAYEVTGGGWELFENNRDLETHTNGIEYKMGTDPLYWYQDGYYLTYYALTYLGKTYSNEVQVSVANYHDLKNVMDATTHHYYIDKPYVKRAPKIYIGNYSSSGDNGLDMLKNLFDLSLLTQTPTGVLAGHAVLNQHVNSCENLEFFLRADQDHSGSSWTPIANAAGECFSGTLHGDGHTVSGLSSSLFNHLCGDVYNLGVTGSFTGAGVAETGSGYVENCWIKTTGTPTKKTEGDTHSHFAVFGEPTRAPVVYVAVAKGTQLTAGETYYTSAAGTGEFSATGEETVGENQYYRKVNNSIVQVVNSYYPESNDYDVPATADELSHGKAVQKEDKAFYNGEVAYDLNGFYLWKRYSDHGTTANGASVATGLDHTYFTTGTDGLEINTSKYADGDINLCSSGVDGAYLNGGYVEDRFRDGDFIYAGGSIPDEPNMRLYTPESSSTVPTGYYPIWPDDYIFFGQRLNYGYVTGTTTAETEARAYQEVPSSIVKTAEDRIETSVEGNRVYRAPAYFRNSEMDVAHFNPYAVFAQTKNGDAATIAYQNMTAIDFTGYRDYTTNNFVKGWAEHLDNGQWSMANGQSSAAFYPPLLDDGGLTAFQNVDLTDNLLVYTGKDAPASATTDGVVEAYLPDRSYEETDSKYKTAKRWDRFSSLEKIHGHRVELTGGSYVAQNDHMLVDEKDFNAPIAYSFADDMRMWYQREPKVYVGKLKDNAGNYRNDTGWEGISLPFTADIVTTNDKGEITHFYKDSRSVSESGSKTGHEYWLREFTGGAMSTETGEENVLKADFRYPGYGDENATGEDKEYTNTFLWDYYYSYKNYDDANSDKYQEDEDNSAYTYYKNSRTYPNYLRLTQGTPYIIGFPGERYYEFDLSGTFSPKNTVDWSVARNLDKQSIIFSSKPGDTHIAVSDTEMAGVTKSVTKGNTTTAYTFKPSYLNDPELETGNYAFLLTADGNSYEEDKVNTTVAKTTAFRPYFTSTAVAGARTVTRSIVFSNEDAQMKGVEDRDLNSKDPGTISIYAKRHKIVVESSIRVETDVRIINAAGVTIAAFTIKPGETVETRITNSGVYIVQAANGQYTEKLAVR